MPAPPRLGGYPAGCGWSMAVSVGGLLVLVTCTWLYILLFFLVLIFLVLIFWVVDVCGDTFYILDWDLPTQEPWFRLRPQARYICLWLYTIIFTDTVLQLSSKVVSRVRRSVQDYRRAHSCRAVQCCDSGRVNDRYNNACGGWPPRKANTALIRCCFTHTNSCSIISIYTRAY